jgi:hypothetical protein
MSICRYLFANALKFWHCDEKGMANAWFAGGLSWIVGQFAQVHDFEEFL